MSNPYTEAHKQILRDALALFRRNEGTGDVRFCGKLSVVAVSFNRSLNHSVREEPYILRDIAQDLWNLAVAVDKLEWMQQAFMSASPDDLNMWRRYASTDIEFIYTQFRSLCDHLSFLAACTFEGVSGKAKKSFHSLIKQVWKEPEAVGPRLVKILDRAGLPRSQHLEDDQDIEREMVRTWFGHMRAVRNDILHRGADSMVFAGPREGIVFQVFRNPCKRTVPALSHLRFDDTHLLHFEKYFALQFANLLVFTEVLSEVIIDKHDIQPGEVYMTGFDVLYSWLADFFQELEGLSSLVEEA